MSAGMFYETNKIRLSIETSERTLVRVANALEKQNELLERVLGKRGLNVTIENVGDNGQLLP